jgi:hypothetical protein
MRKNASAAMPRATIAIPTPIPAPAPGDSPLETDEGVALDDVDEGDEEVVVDAWELARDELEIEVEDVPDVELEDVFDDVVIALFCDQVTALSPARFTNSHVIVFPSTEGLKKKWQNILSVPLVFAVSWKGKVRGDEASFAANVLVYTANNY